MHNYTDTLIEEYTSIQLAESFPMSQEYRDETEGFVVNGVSVKSVSDAPQQLIYSEDLTTQSINKLLSGLESVSTASTQNGCIYIYQLGIDSSNPKYSYYIGQTRLWRLKDRNNEHKREIAVSADDNTKLSPANYFNKILHEATHGEYSSRGARLALLRINIPIDDDNKTLDTWEKYFIEKFKTYDPNQQDPSCLNSTSGGSGTAAPKINLPTFCVIHWLLTKYKYLTDAAIKELLTLENSKDPKSLKFFNSEYYDLITNDNTAYEGIYPSREEFIKDLQNITTVTEKPIAKIRSGFSEWQRKFFKTEYGNAIKDEEESDYYAQVARAKAAQKEPESEIVVCAYDSPEREVPLAWFHTKRRAADFVNKTGFNGKLVPEKIEAYFSRGIGFGLYWKELQLKDIDDDVDVKTQFTKPPYYGICFADKDAEDRLKKHIQKWAEQDNVKYALRNIKTYYITPKDSLEQIEISKQSKIKFPGNITRLPKDIFQAIAEHEYSNAKLLRKVLLATDAMVDAKNRKIKLQDIKLMDRGRVQWATANIIVSYNADIQYYEIERTILVDNLELWVTKDGIDYEISSIITKDRGSLATIYNKTL